MTKLVNYSPENEKFMTTLYQEAETEAERKAVMESLAETMGKTVASIRSKLSHLQVYIAATKPAKSGARVLKADLIDEIAAHAAKKNDSFFESLAGANRLVLDYVIDLQASQTRLANAIDAVTAFEVEQAEIAKAEAEAQTGDAG